MKLRMSALQIINLSPRKKEEILTKKQTNQKTSLMTQRNSKKNLAKTKEEINLPEIEEPMLGTTLQDKQHKKQETKLSKRLVKKLHKKWAKRQPRKQASKPGEQLHKPELK